MSKAKLYYSDAYLKETQTRIIKRKHEQDAVWITLQSTLFYPGGGGQSRDEGWINGQRIQAIKHEEDEYWYKIAENPPDDVILELDWTHRYDKMQQHTGQHILSAVFYRIFNIDTLSVHLGQRDTLIELDCSDLSEEQISRAENEANLYIRQNYQVKAIFITPGESGNYSIRRDIKQSSAELRLIQIGDFDCTGCGGTHVRATAEVGLIKILSSEKIRGHIRICSVIGSAAYQYFTDIHNSMRVIGSKLSSGTVDVPAKIDNLLGEIKLLRRDLKSLSNRWLREYARRLEPDDSIGYFIVSDLTPAEMVQLVQEWLVIYKLPCYVIGRSTNKINFVFGLPAETNPGADEFLKNVSDELSLRGGGNAELIQGVIGQTDLSQDYIQLILLKLKEYYT